MCKECLVKQLQNQVLRPEYRSLRDEYFTILEGSNFKEWCDATIMLAAARLGKPQNDRNYSFWFKNCNLAMKKEIMDDLVIGRSHPIFHRFLQSEAPNHPTKALEYLGKAVKNRRLITTLWARLMHETQILSCLYENLKGYYTLFTHESAPSLLLNVYSVLPPSMDKMVHKELMEKHYSIYKVTNYLAKALNKTNDQLEPLPKPISSKAEPHVISNPSNESDDVEEIVGQIVTIDLDNQKSEAAPARSFEIRNGNRYAERRAYKRSRKQKKQSCCILC